MCEHLKPTHWYISWVNHKDNSAKIYHRFLNKTQAIKGTDRGSPDNFIQNSKNIQYAWNSAPIDDTDIPSNISAIGREFRFPLDVEISATLTINSTPNSGLYNYLHGVSNDALFA